MRFFEFRGSAPRSPSVGATGATKLAEKRPNLKEFDRAADDSVVLDTVYLRLEARQTFYAAGEGPVGPEADTPFARQLRARRQAAGA